MWMLKLLLECVLFTICKVSNTLNLPLTLIMFIILKAYHQAVQLDIKVNQLEKYTRKK